MLPCGNPPADVGVHGAHPHRRLSGRTDTGARRRVSTGPSQAALCPSPRSASRPCLREDASMTWLMPVQFLPFAGLLALVVAWPRISKPASHVRRFVEVLIIGVGTAGACMA